MLERIAILFIAATTLQVSLGNCAVAQDSNPLRVLPTMSRPAVDANTRNQPQVRPAAKHIQTSNRGNTQTTRTTSHQALGAQRDSMPPEVRAAIYQTDANAGLAQNHSNPINHGQPISSAPPMVDENLQSTVYTAPAQPSVAAKPDMSPIVNVLDSLEKKHGSQLNSGNPDRELPLLNRKNATDFDQNQSLLGTAASPANVRPDGVRPQSKAQDLRALVEQLAIGTAVVICFGIGFVLLAKQWFKLKTPTKTNSKTTIQITSTLRLSPKSSLFLIEAGDQRLVVANDQNGIKSVVPLTDSFGGSFEAMLGTEAASDDDLASSTEESSGAYSLATVGASQQAGASSQDADETRSQDPVWEKMEAALSEYGLKDLFLQTMKSQQSR